MPLREGRSTDEMDNRAAQRVHGRYGNDGHAGRQSDRRPRRGTFGGPRDEARRGRTTRECQPSSSPNVGIRFVGGIRSVIGRQYADSALRGRRGFTRQFASKPNRANPTVSFGRGSERTRLGTSAGRAPRSVLASHGPGLGPANG